MENLKECSNLLSVLSDGIADVVGQVGTKVVRVNGRRRRPASGVAYVPNMVLTASHVLEREEDLTVETHNGRTLPARFVGRDPSTDLAVLWVEGLDVEATTLAEGNVRIGQLALAVGSRSRSEGPRASLGIVSSIDGPLRTGRGTRLERYIQTDATHYSGFSGGPLIDARGNVLGIMTVGSARGAALAIPAEVAWRVAKTLENQGSIKRGYLGILSQPVRLPDGQRAGLTQRSGLLVVGVEDGSPAGHGGVLLGDILVTLDGQPVEDTDDLLVLLAGERVGETVLVKVIRGGESQTLQVTIGQRG